MLLRQERHHALFYGPALPFREPGYRKGSHVGQQVSLWHVPALATVLLACASPVSAGDASPAAEALKGVEANVSKAEAIEAVKQLTYMFGYFREARDYGKALALFSDNATYDFAYGQYVGKNSIRRLFGSERFNPAGRRPGSAGPPVLNDRVMMQPVITLDEGGQTASARFKELVFESEHGVSQTYSIGHFENRYIRDEVGAWKIDAVRYCYRLRLPYDTGIAEVPPPPAYIPVPVLYPTDLEGPDRQSSFYCHTYPDAGIDPPFHFDHPVTGERISKP